VAPLKATYGYQLGHEMDSSTGMSYLQNQIQPKKLGYGGEKHFCVQALISQYLNIKIARKLTTSFHRELLNRNDDISSAPCQYCVLGSLNLLVRDKNCSDLGHRFLSVSSIEGYVIKSLATMNIKALSRKTVFAVLYYQWKGQLPIPTQNKPRNGKQNFVEFCRILNPTLFG